MATRETNPGLGRSGRVLPRLENLEERCCPSGVSLTNHVLTLNGGSTNSTMIVSDDGHGDVKVTLNGKTTSMTGVQTVDINAPAGNDTIDYTLTNPLTKSETLNLNLGNGNDTVKMNFTKGLTAPSLKLNINGGGGDQNIETDFGAITNTDLELNASLGNGWDQFTAKFNGTIGGIAKANVNVKGGAGFDGVNVQVNGNIGALAEMTVAETLGNQEGTAHVNYSGKLAGKLTVELQGGASWNWLESHFNLKAGSTGSLVAHELGGPASDLLILTISDVGSHLKSLDALINGGAGFNSAESTPNVRVLNAR